MAEKDVKVTALISEELRRKARLKSAQTGKSMSSVMREALEKWVGGDPPGEPPKKP